MLGAALMSGWRRAWWAIMRCGGYARIGVRVVCRRFCQGGVRADGVRDSRGNGGGEGFKERSEVGGNKLGAHL